MHARRQFHSTHTRSISAIVALASLLGPAGPLFADCPADLDGNAVVNGGDLATLLAAWGARGPADLDGNGVVGGADLAELLSAWGDCPAAPCEGFTPLEFDGTVVDLDAAGLPFDVVLTGTASTGPFGQEGLITALLPGGPPVVIEFHPGFQKLTVGPTVIDVAPTGSPAFVLVNGAPIPVTAAIEMYVADVASGAPVAMWSPLGKAALAMIALTSTPEWSCNVEAALETGGVAEGGNQGGWCKFTAYATATVIAGLAGAGCFALTGTCAAGSVVTIGAMAIPCTTLVGLCAGGTFAGTAAAYEAVLALWGD